MGAKILIIDDEEQICRLLRVTLQVHGFSTIESLTGKDGVLQASMTRPDIILLDLTLPDMNGIDALLQIREWSNVPIIVVTARDDEQGKVIALDNGADDYITKPFGTDELMARIRVALRHSVHQQDEPVLNLGPVTIDLSRRTVERYGQPVKLSPIEYDLFKTLATEAGRVITRNKLVRLVWKEQSYETASHYLRVYIGYLRKKIEDDPTHPTLIVTEPGVGYRLVVAKPH
ncbi:response regulator [Alicyclobacillus ferrooxydans]|uniref:Fis family transcriptional regulator n=1 Tax=Alicyclobacillus ferrooxydans TaxID=471514 RepID=A0A0P9CA72_9BACL|nr:response regulator [Alicyclobacillus ferrooxydans]KPV42302.1 Fis family transcriptional regulator [Alicyclobacillus ferrooxydans]